MRLRWKTKPVKNNKNQYFQIIENLINLTTTKTGNEAETLALFFDFTKGKSEIYSRIYYYAKKKWEKSSCYNQVELNRPLTEAVIFC
jgi:hypothetical protein